MYEKYQRNDENLPGVQLKVYMPRVEEVAVGPAKLSGNLKPSSSGRTHRKCRTNHKLHKLICFVEPMFTPNVVLDIAYIPFLHICWIQAAKILFYLMLQPGYARQNSAKLTKTVQGLRSMGLIKAFGIQLAYVPA